MAIKKNNYFIIVLLILLFVGPMLGAYFLYSNSSSWAGSTINKGFIINPPISIKNITLINPDGTAFDAKNLTGHWSMIFIAPASCDNTCEANLYKMRQVRLALGKDMNRVQRMILTYSEKDNPKLTQLIAQHYSGTLYATTSAAVYQQFFNKHIPETIASKPSSLYLVDPLGEVMMAYPADATPKSLLSDLTRLLNTSQIG